MATCKDIIRIDQENEMLFKDQEAKKCWDEMVKKNSGDIYGRGVVNYARRWAKLMQTLIDEGKKVPEIAEQSSYDADIDGITGFMYGCAVNTLAMCWKFGEELRAWHNSKYGYAGNGTVNPAVLTIQTDG